MKGWREERYNEGVERGYISYSNSCPATVSH